MFSGTYTIFNYPRVSPHRFIKIKIDTVGCITPKFMENLQKKEALSPAKGLMVEMCLLFFLFLTISPATGLMVVMCLFFLFFFTS